MSIYGALSSGVSGLFAQSSRLSAISDNIANANTVGYKRTAVPFSTLVTQQGLQNTYAAGGVRANPYMQIDRQGLLTSTSSSTDLAINGDGFFVTNVSAEPDAEGLDSRTLFTRAGSFRPDANGYLRNDAGLYLQGWKLASNGEFDGAEPARTSFDSLETVNITGLNFTGSPTSEISFAGNLPAGVTGKALPGSPIVTGVEYFDPLGNPNTLNLQWTPGTTYGQWTLDLIQAGDTIPLASYEFQFHTDGVHSGGPASVREVVSSVGQLTANTIEDNADTFTGDVLRFDVSGMTVDGTARDVTVGGVTIPNTAAYAFTPQTTDSEEAIAQKLRDAIVAHIDAGNAIAGVTADNISVSGTVVTIVGDNTQDGAQLVANGGGVVAVGGGGATLVTATADPDNDDALVGDIIEIDVTGQAENWENTDVMTVTVNGYSFKLDSTTTPPLDASSDTALANTIQTALATEVTNGTIPGVTDPLKVTIVGGSKIQIEGDAADASGSGLAGRTEYAIQVTRDTRQNTQFVDADGFNINPLNLGDEIIARLALPLPGSGTQSIDIDLGAIDTLNGVTQFAGEYAPTLIERDGAQFGSLDRVEIDEEGVMNAVFNNGQIRPIYRLPVINFVNPNGLLALDGNAFQATAAAGAYYMWDAGSGPAGSIAGSALEASTVDIAEEFSNMIVTQRAYSSNAKIIQTADEMLQQVTNLKR